MKVAARIGEGLRREIVFPGIIVRYIIIPPSPLRPEIIRRLYP